MTPEQYDQVRDLFLVAREKMGDDRTRFLDEACGVDVAVRREVESLLCSDEKADTFLNTPVLGSKFAVLDPSLASGAEDTHRPPAGRRPPSRSNTAPEKTHPESLGGYEILGILGEGGMGVVYRAQQDNPRRIVALKAIKPGIESRETLTRFKHEGQMLGRLQHPGIAQVFEASTADSGRGPQPFFAMELIEGMPLTTHAHKSRLGVDARLGLVAKVCDAVHHAHQKGIIHRDLKPNNILVDATGQPKILDFGVARVTDADVRTVTMQTAVGQLVGTIAYMSPEQIQGDPADLDTRSDVYGLGVICYELLTGRLPFDVSAKTIPQAARTIVEDEPASLSSINKVFRGDIEAIVVKAMEKDKKDRYQSASELAQDIRRFLSDQPISARPVTTLYQLKKFARRNKALVTSVIIAFAVLSFGLVYVTLERNRAVRAEKLAEQRFEEAEQQRTIADRQAAIARAVNAFLNEDLLAAASPGVAGPDATVREVLDKAAWAIEGRFKKQPLIEAAIRDTIGQAYSNLGLFDQAEQHLKAAVEIGTRLQGEDHEDTIISLGNMALLLKRQGRLDEAEQISRRVLDNSIRTLGEEHNESQRAMNNLAALLATSEKWEEAEGLMRRTIQIRRQSLGEEHPSTLTAMNNMGLFLTDNGKVDRAEPLLRKVWEAERRVLGEDHPDTITTLNNLAAALVDLGRVSEGQPLLRQVLDLRSRVLGKDHPDTLASMNNLASLLSSQGELAEAGALFRDALDVLQVRLGDRHHKTLITMNNLAGILRGLEEYDESEKLYRQCLETFRTTLGNEHPKTLGTMNNLAVMLDNAGRPEEAEPLYREALATLRGIVGDRHPTVLAMMNNLAHLLRKQDKLEQAEVLYKELLGLADLTLPEGHWHRGIYRGAYGECLIQMKRYEEAEPHCLQAHAYLEGGLGATHPRVVSEVAKLVNLYTLWEKPDKLAMWQAKQPTTQPAPAPSD